MCALLAPTQPNSDEEIWTVEFDARENERLPVDIESNMLQLRKRLRQNHTLTKSRPHFCELIPARSLAVFSIAQYKSSVLTHLLAPSFAVLCYCNLPYHSIFAHHPPIVNMAKTLRYYPLPTMTSNRLLNLWPSKHLDDQILCQTRIVDLRDSPKYHALSYTWVAPNPAVQIFCNEQPVDVTPSLAASLRRLRYERHQHLLWVDAICLYVD
jgi:hypothetical protein